MFSILDFVVLTCAASGVLHVWFRGSIFDGPRAYLEARQDSLLASPPADEVVAEDDLPPSDPLPLWMRLADRLLPDWSCELLLCTFCFSHHTPWIVALLTIVPANVLWELRESSLWLGTLAILLKVPAYSFAATRIANVLHSLLPDEARYRDRTRTTASDSAIPRDLRSGDDR